MTFVGLISDTHLPDRWDKLPAAVFDLFKDVDLILHAGDVGVLRVLDELGNIAPVVAVHGNDELDDRTVHALPYHQVVCVADHRLLLSHAHYPNRADELASRVDSWQPTLQRRVDMGRAHDADIVIFGHTHIPMSVEVDGTWLINPGAIASGNHLTRQTLQSVARLRLDEKPHLEFFDLNRPDRPFMPDVDLDAGFAAAMAHVSEPIVTPELQRGLMRIFQDDLQVAREYVVDVLRPLAFRRWTGGESSVITPAEFMQAVMADRELPAPIKAALGENPVFAPYL